MASSARVVADFVPRSRVRYVQDLPLPGYRAQQGREPAVLRHVQLVRQQAVRHGDQDWFLCAGREEKAYGQVDAWSRICGVHGLGIARGANRLAMRACLLTTRCVLCAVCSWTWELTCVTITHMLEARGAAHALLCSSSTALSECKARLCARARGMVHSTLSGREKGVSCHPDTHATGDLYTRTNP